MKIQKLTLPILLDLLFGCLIPTLFVVPPLLYILFNSHINLVTFIILASLLSLTNLWIVVLKGHVQSREKKRFRNFSIVTGIIGLVIQTLHFLIFDFKINFLISFFSKIADISKSQELFNHSGVLFMTGMIGSFIIGEKYLWLLIEKGKSYISIS